MRLESIICKTFSIPQRSCNIYELARDRYCVLVDVPENISSDFQTAITTDGLTLEKINEIPELKSPFSKTVDRPSYGGKSYGRTEGRSEGRSDGRSYNRSSRPGDNSKNRQTFDKHFGRSGN